MRLKEIAHARTGDKGEISNISIIPYCEEDFEFLKESLTAEKVKAYFADICKGEVIRYEVPGIKAFNFVLDKTLGGGVTRSLAIDKHGKSLGMALLEMEIDDRKYRKKVEAREVEELNVIETKEILGDKKSVRIGSGAGYAGDRIDGAVELVEHGELDYLILECLAERTIALGQKEKQANPNLGYNFLLESRMQKLLPAIAEKKIRVVTNMGSANPIAAGKKVLEIAKELNLKELKISCVLGDDVEAHLPKYMQNEILESGRKLEELQENIVSANAYMGAEGIVKALQDGADIVITGRVADPSLTVGILAYEYGWEVEKHPEQMGQAVLAGHLLECAGQVTGGYYADPGYKEVQGLEHLGFPIVEMAEDGQFVVTKTKQSGGLVSVDTCKEQMIYEIHDPTCYMTPDAIADFSEVTFKQMGKDMVLVQNATSHGKPDTLKVSVGYKDCYIGEGEISYGGANCMERAYLAADIISKRMELLELKCNEFRVDHIGVDSLFQEKISKALCSNPLSEVRVRFSGRFDTKEEAESFAYDIETLYTNGPAGGGGITRSVNEVLSICSIFIPREEVPYRTKNLWKSGNSMMPFPFWGDDFEMVIKQESEEFGVLVDLDAPCHQWSNNDEEIQLACVEAIEKKYKGRKGGIIFYGPSNIQMWYSLEQDMQPFTAQNHGMGGCVDAEMIKYAPRMLYAFEPGIVFFQTGSNDLANGWTLEQIYQNKKEMYQEFLAHMPETKLVIMSGLPLPGRQEYWEDTVKINQFLKEMCENTERLYFMDATEAMKATDGTPFNRNYFRKDGIHLNKVGHDIWTAEMKKIIVNELQKNN